MPQGGRKFQPTKKQLEFINTPLTVRMELYGLNRSRRMLTGKIRSLPEGKNFGFIQGDGKKDYFFHRDDFKGFWNDLLKDFRSGQSIEVEFEPSESVKGLRAANVSRLDHPNQAV